jgi:hypothetical protein
VGKATLFPPPTKIEYATQVSREMVLGPFSSIGRALDLNPEVASSRLVRGSIVLKSGSSSAR